jgi:hypothetical protein
MAPAGKLDVALLHLRYVSKGRTARRQRVIQRLALSAMIAKTQSTIVAATIREIAWCVVIAPKMRPADFSALSLPIR